MYKTYFLFSLVIFLLITNTYSSNSFKLTNQVRSVGFNQSFSKFSLIDDSLQFTPQPTKQFFNSFGLAMAYGASGFFTAAVLSEVLIFKMEDFLLGASLIGIPIATIGHVYGAAYGCYLPVKQYGGEYKYALKSAMIGMGISLAVSASIYALYYATNIEQIAYLMPSIYIIPSLVTTKLYNKKYRPKLQ